MEEGFKIFHMRMKVRDHRFFQRMCKNRNTTMSKAIMGYINYLRSLHNKKRILFNAETKHKLDFGYDGQLFESLELEQERKDSEVLPI